jgi:hypothetical protein
MFIPVSNFPIPVPGSKKIQDPGMNISDPGGQKGTGSRIRIRNTVSLTFLTYK